MARPPGATREPAQSDAPDAGPAESELVDRARRGDHEAFRTLVERYQDRVYGLARRILRDPERARDAVQDGFLKAYAGLPRFEGRSGFYTWLYRLVFNQCIDMKRRDRSSRHEEWDEEIARDVAPGSDTGPLPVGNELADPAISTHLSTLE